MGIKDNLYSGLAVIVWLRTLTALALLVCSWRTNVCLKYDDLSEHKYTVLDCQLSMHTCLFRLTTTVCVSDVFAAKEEAFHMVDTNNSIFWAGN